MSVADNKNCKIYALEKIQSSPLHLARYKRCIEELKKSLIHHLNGRTLDLPFNYTHIKNINKHFERKLSAKIDGFWWVLGQIFQQRDDGETKAQTSAFVHLNAFTEQTRGHQVSFYTTV